VTGQLHSPAAVRPRERTCNTHRRGQVDLRTVLHVVVTRKIPRRRSKLLIILNLKKPV